MVRGKQRVYSGQGGEVDVMVPCVILMNLWRVSVSGPLRVLYLVAKVEGAQEDCCGDRASLIF